MDLDQRRYVCSSLVTHHESSNRRVNARKPGNTEIGKLDLALKMRLQDSLGAHADNGCGAESIQGDEKHYQCCPDTYHPSAHEVSPLVTTCCLSSLDQPDQPEQHDGAPPQISPGAQATRMRLTRSTQI